MIWLTLPYGVPCCMGSQTTEQALQTAFLLQMDTCVTDALDKAYAQELFGYDSECSFNKVNNIMYLFDILMWIYRDWQLNPTNTKDDYYAMFDIDCWRKTFMCCGCNITSALAVFGL